MKVKVGDKVYNSKEVPVMIILNLGEKEQIATMHSGCTRYCVYPEDKYTVEEIKKWMLDPPKEDWEKKIAREFESHCLPSGRK